MVKERDEDLAVAALAKERNRAARQEEKARREERRKEARRIQR